MTLLNKKNITTFLLGSCLLALPSMSSACDKEAVLTYQKALVEIKNVDQSVHHFLTSLESNQSEIDLLVQYYIAPQFIEEYQRRVNKLVESFPKKTKGIKGFFLCQGIKSAEIESRFGSDFKAQSDRVSHLQTHETDMQEASFTEKVNQGHKQSVLIFGDQESSVLLPLQETQGIVDFIHNEYASKASIYDLWSLKQAKGSKEFMQLTGLDIMKGSPEAKLQAHLAKGLSKDSFLMLGGPSEGQEYPQTIQHLAAELSAYNGTGTLPSEAQLPNRSKLAILAMTNDKNLKQARQILKQYQTAATQFKERATKQFKITVWQRSVNEPKNLNEELQAWAITNYQQMVHFEGLLEKLLNPKEEIEWQALKQVP